MYFLFCVSSSLGNMNTYFVLARFSWSFVQFDYMLSIGVVDKLKNLVSMYLLLFYEPIVKRLKSW
jgi:hypothetical protein